MAKPVRVVPPLPASERGVLTRLSTDAAGDLLLYCNQNNVIWRPLATMAGGAAKPEDIFCYRAHARKTMCCAMSPNSQWVASGDETGALRLWGAKGDHVLKNEYKLWSGTVKDVQWSGDSQRIAASGDGKEVRACAMIWDTGSKTGEIGGHTQQINSISIKPQRPFRVITGGEDMLVRFFEGPPFKFKESHRTHTNFVNSVRFSPDGEWAVSVGSDAKVLLYDGKEGSLAKEFAKPDGISGSLWEVAWSPDSKRFVTAGGDKRLRIWDVETGSQACEALVGEGALEDMQQGVSWASPDRIVSVAVNGRLVLWDFDSGACALKLAAVVEGTQGPLSCLAYDLKTGTLVSGGPEGYVACTPAEGPTRTLKVGKSVQHVITHTGRAAAESAAEVLVIALDDTVRRVSLETMQLVGEPVAVKEFTVAADWLDKAETKLLLASGKNSFHCVSATGVDWSMPSVVERRPTSLAISPTAPGGTKLAVAIDKPDTYVGGVPSQQYDILLFGVAGLTPDGIKLETTLSGHNGEVCAVAFNPAGDLLASCDANKKIHVWNMADNSLLVSSDFNFHAARVTTLAWLPNGRQFVSAGLDKSIYVWNVDDKGKRICVEDVHRGGVAKVVACGEADFASAGLDGFVWVHKIG